MLFRSKLPLYNPPPGPFTNGTNGVGVVEAVGREVWHLKPGQRVVLSSHFVAAENVEDPAQILIGLTSSPDAAQVLADWPDGTLAEYALMPVAALTPAEGWRNSIRRSLSPSAASSFHSAVCSEAGWRPARHWW